MYTTSLTRIRKTSIMIVLVGIILFLCFMVGGLPAAHSQEKEILPEAIPNSATPLSKGPLQQINKYFSTQTIIYNDGTSVERNIINAPPTPPPGIASEPNPV